MATVRTLIGYVKGPKGDKGDTGATGAQGPAGQNGAPGVTDYATTETAGLVRVGDDFNINSSNGVLSIKNAFTRASALAKMVTDEAFATTLGKIAKAVDWVVDNAPNFFNKNTDIVDGFTSALTDKALSANAGKTLKTQLDSLNDSFSNAALLSFRSEILTRADQITLTALATLPLGTYIVQCPTAPADFPYQTAYGVLLHYGSLLNYHHMIFTTAGQGERSILYVDFSGTVTNTWKKVSEDAISANASGISALQTTVNGHTTSISNNASAISSLQTTVSGHTTAIANNASAISANTNAINSLIAYKDLSATTAAAGGVAQINSLSGYIISKDNFLQAYVIGSNTISLRIYTYGDLLYVKPITVSGADAPAGTYTIRCVYVPRGISAAS